MNNRSFVWLIALLVLVGVGVLVIPQTGWFDRPIGQADRRGLEALTQNSEQSNPNKVEAPTLSKALGISEEDLVEVGGIKRPKRDVAPDSTVVLADDSAGNSREEPKSDQFSKSLFTHPGAIPIVAADANGQVAGLYRELTSEDPPDAARSARFAPESFDLKAYEADPEGYLTQIRPGRVYEPAQPGPDVKRLESRSPMFQHVVQGEKLVLEVLATPGMPVTYYTPQVGEFENRLTTYSVAADEDGVARAVYTVSSGSLGIVDILAASPVHSGQLQFKVRVELQN